MDDLGGAKPEDSKPARVAQNDPLSGYPIDLRLHELRPDAHTIAIHVGKSPQYLLDRASKSYDIGFQTIVVYRAGSFPSLLAATKLVNATITKNKTVVDRVASGALADAFITAEFDSKTEIEAYRPNEFAQPHIRDTFGVGVYIVNDPNMPEGFTIITAYPRNE